MVNERLVTFDSLHILETLPETRLKKIFRATDGRLTLAVKIIKTEDDTGAAISDNKRASLARQELRAYTKFKGTSIGVYVPDPYFLINEESEPVGLAVDWREGEMLCDYERKKPLAALELDALALAFQRLADSGFTPNSDMFSEFNIGIGISRFPRLWLAECAIDNSSAAKRQYLKTLEGRMRHLRDNYVANK